MAPLQLIRVLETDRIIFFLYLQFLCFSPPPKIKFHNWKSCIFHSFQLISLLKSDSSMSFAICVSVQCFFGREIIPWDDVRRSVGPAGVVLISKLERPAGKECAELLMTDSITRGFSNYRLTQWRSSPTQRT
jgi:hypothetical protein